MGSGPISGAFRAADLQDKMLGEFRLLRRLGGGGMAEVWLAEQTSLRRQVAVKVMRPDIQSDETCRRRFEHEALAAAGLNHPNIVQVYGIGETDGIRYIAQEYVQGMNMRDYIAKKGPPPVHIAVHIMKQVAAALQAAGEQGIVHRDVKPENILLTRKGVAKVADFGLAQLTQLGDMRLTQAGMTMGTPLYMSPEQVQGKKVDQRSDLYSLGVTFYHLLAGRPPFRGESAFAVAYHQVHSEPPPLSATRSDLPAALCELVHRMLAKNPEQRFASAQAILVELRTLEKQNGRDEDLMTFAEPTSAIRPRTDWPERLRQLSTWLNPRLHPWGSFALWGILAVLVSSALGARVSNPSPLRTPVKNQSRVEKQATIKRQLDFAMRQNSDEAWLAVLTLFEGNGPEKHAARQALIPRLIKDLRLRSAERLCRDVIADRNAPEPALATAWAGLALVHGLQGNLAEAGRLMDREVRPRESSAPGDMREWLHELLNPRRTGESPPRFEEPDGRRRNFDAGRPFPPDRERRANGDQGRG